MPDYEREFLWDHSYALRGGRGRRRNRDCDRRKNNDEREGREEQLKVWVTQMWESFHATQMRKMQTGESSFSRSNAITPSPTTSNFDRPRRRSVRSDSAETVHSAPDPEEVSRRRRNSRTLTREGSRTSLPAGIKTRPHHRADSTGDERAPSRSLGSIRRFKFRLLASHDDRTRRDNSLPQRPSTPLGH